MNEGKTTFFYNFMQQSLPSFRPLITPLYSMIIFIFISCLCFVFGIIFIIYDNKVVSIDYRYDNQCPINNTCHIKLNIPKEMEGNIFLKYELTNFNQNQQRFINGKCPQQLLGDYADFDGMYDCANLRSINGTSEPDSWLVPCGLAAVSLFNDTFKVNSDQYQFQESGIAWESDIEYLYEAPNKKYNDSIKWLENNKNFVGGQTNEHFIVWMRPSSLSTVIKTYSVCKDCNIQVGDFDIEIESNYRTDYFFKGEKHVILTTESIIGGKNKFLGIAYIIIASLSLITTFATLIERSYSPRMLGDMKLINKKVSESCCFDGTCHLQF